ncbi:MAG: DnaD domain protein [Tenericutes bacterium]|nr:DnaD domain protein [Mycoplasmatota bacterium]MDO4376826.1 DnaD domain protein [bacterium]
MNSKVIDLLKSKNYVVSDFLIKNYKVWNLDVDEFIILIYLMNSSNLVCDYKLISSELGMDLELVMNKINELSIKKLLEIKVLKNSSNKLEEQISLDLLYNKVFMQIIDVKEEEDKSNIYSVFESELGRTLSPIEYELINGWLECNYKEEIILAALKEAVFNGVNNFRYIDRILFEWNKKGIDTVDKISKYKKEFRKDTNVEVPDYDWLNDK